MGEEKEGEARECSWEGEHSESSALRVFKGCEFKEGLRGRSQNNIHQLY